MKLTIGTRGSALALWQARYVAETIAKKHPETDVDLIRIKTTGDKILDTPLAKIGGKGLFTKEIEEALLDGRVDIAVHSMKDLPTELPSGLKPAAVLEREDPRDVFVSADGKGLADLRPGDRVGTSSLRRQSFLLSKYPGLELVDLRGNVDTRLKKIQTEGLAGAVLAAAGLIRMGLAEQITEFLPLHVMIPAIGQGAMGIENRIDDPEVDALIADLNHADTAVCVAIERAFLFRMGGGCQVPLAAHATMDGDSVRIEAAVVHPTGTPMIRESTTEVGPGVRLGNEVADRLIGRGGDEIMKRVLGPDWKPGVPAE